MRLVIHVSLWGGTWDATKVADREVSIEADLPTLMDLGVSIPVQRAIKAVLDLAAAQERQAEAEKAAGILSAAAQEDPMA